MVLLLYNIDFFFALMVLNHAKYKNSPHLFKFS